MQRTRPVLTYAGVSSSHQKGDKEDESQVILDNTQSQDGAQEPANNVLVQSEDSETLLTSAQRRKKIKQEILIAGQGEGFKGYKRRQW